MKIRQKDASILVRSDCRISVTDGSETFDIWAARDLYVMRREKGNDGRMHKTVDRSRNLMRTITDGHPRTVYGEMDPEKQYLRGGYHFYVYDRKKLTNIECASPYEEFEDELNGIFDGRRLELISFEFGSEQHPGDRLLDMMHRINRDYIPVRDLLRRFPDADIFSLKACRPYDAVPGDDSDAKKEHICREGLNSDHFDDRSRMMLEDSFIGVESVDRDCCDHSECGFTSRYRFRIDGRAREWLDSFLDMDLMRPLEDMYLYKGDRLLMSSVSHEGIIYDERNEKAISADDLYPSEHATEEDGPIIWERIV